MTNQSEIDKAVSLLRNEGYKVEKNKIKVIKVNTTMDKDVYTFTTSHEIPFERLWLIKPAIESALEGVSQNLQRDEVAIKELLNASIERSEKIEKDAKEEIHKAYEDFINNLNNYKYK